MVGEVTQVERVLWCPFATLVLAAWVFLACKVLLHLSAQGLAWDQLLAGGKGSAYMLTCPAIVLVLLPALATLPRCPSSLDPTQVSTSCF